MADILRGPAAVPCKEVPLYLTKLFFFNVRFLLVQFYHTLVKDFICG